MVVLILHRGSAPYDDRAEAGVWPAGDPKSVETIELGELLMGLGCEVAQGYELSGR